MNTKRLPVSRGESKGSEINAELVLIEKEAAEHSVGSSGRDDVNGYVPGDIPFEVAAILEVSVCRGRGSAGNASGIEHSAGICIHYLDRLRPSPVVPIQNVDR